MKVIIYGFATDIACHNIKDIYFFFLIFTVLIVITGRYIEKNCVSRRYMYLIRYGKIGNFWKRLWMKALILTAAEAAVLFGGMGAINACAGWNIFQDKVILPLILWFASLSAIASLQMAFGFFPRAFLLSFCLVIGMEAFSVYAYPFIGSVADFMPGSYMMLRRMNAMEGTMPVLAALVVEIIFIIIVGLFGHRLYRRSNS